MNQRISTWGVPHNSNGELKTEVTASALPTGASTEAKQDVMITHIDGVEAKLDSVITAVQSIDIDTSAIDLNTDGLETLATAGNASLASIATNTTGLNNCVSGTELQVDIVSGTITLPSGASTEAKQDTMITHLSSIDTAVNGTLTVDGSGVTQPVSASSLPLPTGASTEATLSSLNGKVPSQGSALTASSIPVNIASDQTVPVSGTFWQATQPVSGTVTANLSATDNSVLDSIDTAVNGTLTVDGSGVTQPVSASSLPLPTGASTEATLSSLNGKVPSQGSALTALSIPVNIASDQTVPVSGTFWQATQPVSGTVTANAGTNLNTSALALESGGNLADIKTAVEILDNCVSGNEMQVDIVSAPTISINKQIQRASATITNDSTATALSGTLNDTVKTETIDADGYEVVNIHMTTTNSTDGIEIQGSIDGSNWDFIDTVYATTYSTDYSRQWSSHSVTHGKFTYRYYRVANNSGNNIPFSSFKYSMMR